MFSILNLVSSLPDKNQTKNKNNVPLRAASGGASFMNRIRFSKPGAAAEPATPPVSPFEARSAAPEPAPPNPSQAAQASKEDRDVIEHVQSRLLAEPSNPTTKREADYY